MHIHGMQMNFNQVSLQSAAASEKTAAAQRAAEVRKKLLKRAEGTDDELNPEESFMIGRWLEEDSYQGQGQHRHYSPGENQTDDER
jgi:hypothetical protein